MDEGEKTANEADVVEIIPSGTPVLGVDDATVGHVVAVERGGLLVEQADVVGGDVSLLHVPHEVVAGAGEGAVRLTVDATPLEAAEQARTELLAALREARLTPDRVRILRAVLGEMRTPPDEQD